MLNVQSLLDGQGGVLDPGSQNVSGTNIQPMGEMHLYDYILQFNLIHNLSVKGKVSICLFYIYTVRNVMHILN